MRILKPTFKYGILSLVMLVVGIILGIEIESQGYKADQAQLDG